MLLRPTLLACWALASLAVRADEPPPASETTTTPTTVPTTAPTTVPTTALPLLRIAVYELARSDVSEQVGLVTTGALTAELRKLERVSVLGMDEVRAMIDLEAQKQLAGCSAESCLSEIAEALGADVVITGSLAQVGDATFLSLKKIEQTTASVQGQFTRKLAPAHGEEFLAVIGPAVQEMFADRPLRPGQTRGAPKTLAARLNPPPLEPWVFWTAAAITGAAGAATSASGAVLLGNYAHFDELRSGSVAAGSDLLPTRDEVTSGQTGFYVALGITGALAAGTALTSLFVDWNGYRSDGSDR
jgi:hypothetical protein